MGYFRSHAPTAWECPYGGSEENASPLNLKLSDDSAFAFDSKYWVFARASGEHLELHTKYEPRVNNRTNPADVKSYSAKNHGLFQFSRQGRSWWISCGT
jgi:hypothetical protein